MCHGIAPAGAFGAFVADRLIHALLVLGLLRESPGDQQDEEAETSAATEQTHCGETDDGMAGSLMRPGSAGSCRLTVGLARTTVGPSPYP